MKREWTLITKHPHSWDENNLIICWMLQTTPLCIWFNVVSNIDGIFTWEFLQIPFNYIGIAMNALKDLCNANTWFDLFSKLHIIFRGIWKYVKSCSNKLVIWWWIFNTLSYNFTSYTITLDHICMPQRTFDIQIGFKFWKKSSYIFLIF
jgi:hypothetical protein